MFVRGVRRLDGELVKIGEEWSLNDTIDTGQGHGSPAMAGVDRGGPLHDTGESRAASSASTKQSSRKAIAASRPSVAGRAISTTFDCDNGMDGDRGATG